MPRYKCKVDVILTFDIELNAIDKEEAEHTLEHINLNLNEYSDLNRETVSIEELPEIAALFTYPPLPDTASDRMKEAYKVMVEEIQLASEQSVIDDSLNQESKEKIRKQSDTTKITQKQYDEIIATYSDYKKGLILGVNSSDKLTKYLNSVLGLNKSRSVYSKIWNGGVDRESLPKGE